MTTDSTTTTIELDLERLQSHVFARRKAAARRLGCVVLDPNALQPIPADKLQKLAQAIRDAAKAAVDPVLFKREMSFGALAPCSVGIVLCMLLPLIDIRPGAIPWALASAWSLFWYFHTVGNTVRRVTKEARDALKMGHELGVFAQPGHKLDA